MIGGVVAGLSVCSTLRLWVAEVYTWTRDEPSSQFSSEQLSPSRQPASLSRRQPKPRHPPYYAQTIPSSLLKSPAEGTSQSPLPLETVLLPLQRDTCPRRFLRPTLTRPSHR